MANKNNENNFLGCVDRDAHESKKKSLVPLGSITHATAASAVVHIYFSTGEQFRFMSMYSTVQYSRTRVNERSC